MELQTWTNLERLWKPIPTWTLHRTQEHGLDCSIPIPVQTLKTATYEMVGTILCGSNLGSGVIISPRRICPVVTLVTNTLFASNYQEMGSFRRDRAIGCSEVKLNQIFFVMNGSVLGFLMTMLCWKKILRCTKCFATKTKMKERVNTVKLPSLFQPSWIVVGPLSVELILCESFKLVKCTSSMFVLRVCNWHSTKMHKLFVGDGVVLVVFVPIHCCQMLLKLVAIPTTSRELLGTVHTLANE
mmetsp:Transcript_27132/g.41648  ORF Transcript_27132/g.41648 Transcript_27132/m.41648 type:complete len:242 (-) Transcript_27132:656-1381(-)